MLSSRRPVDWVVFDLGETLVDETATWGRWADHLGVPHLTFFAVLGAVIADRRPHTEVFEHFRPGFCFEQEWAKKATPWHVGPDDLYPDALPALRRLRCDGYRLAVMANQPVEVSPFLSTLPVDVHATSAQWGLSKPDPRFFDRLLATVGAEPERVAYVGDRVDNDVVPAAARDGRRARPARAVGDLARHVAGGGPGRLADRRPRSTACSARFAGAGRRGLTLDVRPGRTWPGTSRREVRRSAKTWPST